MAVSSTASPTIPAPTPGVDLETKRHERLDGGIRRHPFDVALAAVLAAHEIAGRKRPDRVDDLELLVADGLAWVARWRLHGQQADDLQQMVLAYARLPVAPKKTKASASARELSRCCVLPVDDGVGSVIQVGARSNHDFRNKRDSAPAPPPAATLPP